MFSFITHDFLIVYYMQILRDKKLKGQLAVREDLYGKSAKAAAKIEKVNVISQLFFSSVVFSVSHIFRFR